MEDDIEISSSDTEELVYTVQEGDTLGSIAMKKNIPLAWILEINGLCSYSIDPGHVLRVFEPPVQLPSPKPINAALFQPQDRSEVPGLLSIDFDILRFKPSSTSIPPIIVNLLGHLENANMPHPRTMELGVDLLNPNAIYVLVLTYLKDPYDNTSMTTSCFAAKNYELEIYKFHIDHGAQIAQQQHHFNVPNPNEIAVRQPQSSPSSRRRVPMKDIIVTGKSEIFEMKHVNLIRALFPNRIRKLNWKLVYQLSNDGCSYQTMYRQSKQAEPALLLIETDSHEKIGAYLPLGLRRSKDYYGNGETFIFKLTPTFQAFHWSRLSSNKFFISSTLEEIAIGGGGSVAIWLGPNLFEGYSHACNTFASPPLTQRFHFRVINVEVWKIGEGSKRRSRSPDR